ncbi:MAG: hypothetical protein IPM80_20180 [Proteobacteria bacterium]|jgi:benzoyl-CoA 2,3-dioxygenase component B|nr:hypothetical protein [Pseudomonadota bacterium]
MPTIHEYMHFHVNLSEDLFGSGIWTNTAHYFTQVLKGRYPESRLADDHEVQASVLQVTETGRCARWIAPPRLGINNPHLDFP